MSFSSFFFSASSRTHAFCSDARQRLPRFDKRRSWPALQKWTRAKLSEAHGDLRLHAGGLEFALKVKRHIIRVGERDTPNVRSSRVVRRMGERYAKRSEL